MYYSTGLYDAEIDYLASCVAYVCRAYRHKPWCVRLSVRTSAVVYLTYLRNNISQLVLAEMYDVSQPTISRIICRMGPVIETILQVYRPIKKQLSTTTSYLVDGTIVPCWRFKAHNEAYSGKTKGAGMNLQVISDLRGNLIYTADPVNGSTHDSTAFINASIIPYINPHEMYGDKGYQGTPN